MLNMCQRMPVGWVDLFFGACAACGSVRCPTKQSQYVSYRLLHFGALRAAAGGITAERAGSGDSLTSLPKLQPVHRLAKPDLKIVQRIGEGAFGEVSVAKAPLYGTVAVKWLKVCVCVCV